MICLQQRLDEWYSGNIIRRVEVAVPNTDIKLVSFDVRYTMINKASAEEEETKEFGIKSDRIRLLATEDGKVVLGPYEAAAAAVNANTGEFIMRE